MDPVTLTLQPIIQLFAFTITMWLVGLGGCTMAGKQGWYCGVSKKILFRAIINPLKKLFVGLWNKHWKLIVGFIAGIIFILWVNGYFDVPY